MLKDLRSLNYDEMSTEIINLGFPKFRVNQIFSWVHEKCVDSFDEMTNLSKDMRNQLSNRFYISKCNINTKLVSQIDNTVKYLFVLPDGEYVESVVMKYKYGYSICISTQVGCKMGCTFCASAIGGFVRQLSVGEMLSEIYTAQNDLGVKINHLVLMGTGEPLDNYDNVIKMLENKIFFNETHGASYQDTSFQFIAFYLAKCYNNKNVVLKNRDESSHELNDLLLEEYINNKEEELKKRYDADGLPAFCRDYPKQRPGGYHRFYGVPPEFGFGSRGGCRL